MSEKCECRRKLGRKKGHEVKPSRVKYLEEKGFSII